MRPSELAEELLEELWILTQEEVLGEVTIKDLDRDQKRRERRERRHGKIQASQESIITELLEIGLIHKKGDIIHLTEKGVLEAKAVIEDVDGVATVHMTVIDHVNAEMLNQLLNE